MIDDGSNVVSRFWEEVFNRGYFEAIDDVVAPTYVLRDPASGRNWGRESLPELLEKLRGVLEDTEAAVKDQTVAKGDWIVSRMTLRGRLPSDQAQAGRFLEPKFVDISRVSAGRINETYVFWEANPVGGETDWPFPFPPW